MTTREHSGPERDFRTLYDFFEKSFESGNFEELVARFYTDDVVFEGHGVPKVVGKAALIAAFKGARAAGLSRIKVDSSEPAKVSGDLAYQFITNDNHFATGVEVHRAIIVWRRTADGWKCEVDFFCPRA